MSVQLGFLEPLEWTLSTQRDLSISRLGGLPTFPVRATPEYKDFQCGVCSNPMRLLIQLYAPPAETEDILRVIYVFLCKDGRCQKPGFSSAFKVFRVQTGWNNLTIPQTCQICGLPGTLCTPSSEPFVFCTQSHLDRYLRSLSSSRPKAKGPPQDIAWKPMEIASEEEPEMEVEIDLSRMGLEAGSRVEEDESTVGEVYSKPEGDRTFQKFVNRLERAPEQILRYLRIEGVEGEVLECNSERTLKKEDFPTCRSCGGNTTVEFQIMPGLLVQMDSDIGGPQDLDWGLLNILTCVKNCKSEKGFVEEYLWRQEVSQEGLKSG